MATTTRFRAGDRVRVETGRVWRGQLGTVRGPDELDKDALRIHVDGDPETHDLPFGDWELALMESAPINVPGRRDDGEDLPPDLRDDALDLIASGLKEAELGNEDDFEGYVRGILTAVGRL